LILAFDLLDLLLDQVTGGQQGSAGQRVRQLKTE